MASLKVQYFLDTYPSLKYNAEKQKITCNLTKHEMPATEIAIESYVKGKKFTNAFRNQVYNYEQHKPHIISSTKKNHLHELFCTLTLRHIGKTPVDVERHIRGKKFKRALAKWQKCQETGEKFLPRGGGRPSNRSVVSDNGSSNGDDDFRSDDDGDDDMSDLYPAADFQLSDRDAGATCDGSVSGKHRITETLLSTVVKTTASDSDSDYDMSVLDNGSSNELKPSLSQTCTSSLVALKKKKRLNMQTDDNIKRKKKDVA